MDPDELTLDDLFRPEPPGQPQQAAQHYQQPHYPSAQPPYAQPQVQPHVQQPQPPHVQQPPAPQGGFGEWQQAEPWQGQAWGAPQGTAPEPDPGSADETQLIAPYSDGSSPVGGQPSGGHSADSHPIGGHPTGHPGAGHPGTSGYPDTGAHPGGFPDGAADETRQIPQIPQSFPPVPPIPTAPPEVSANPSPRPSRPSAPRSHRQQPQTQQQRSQANEPAGGSPFTIRPGLPSGAYGEEPSYVTPGEEEDGSADETRVLPPVTADTPAPAPAPGYPPAPQAHAQPQPQPQHRAPVPTPQYQPAPPVADPVPPGPPPPPRSRRAASGPSRGGRRLPPAVLVSLVVVGCVAVGLGAAAAFSSGGDGDSRPDDAKQNAGSSSTAPKRDAKDPVKAQAEDLNALLKDSNQSRSTVISAVNDIRRCDDLRDAARNLRDAAAQRNDLVSKLSELDLSKLPNHAELTSALNKGWASSASADNHYASWADQVDRKHGCRKGRARVTLHRHEGDRASGNASQAKQRAADLWNGIAKRYGLPQRTRTDL
ncbi:hypothetical protein GCM10012280_24010 [Wenjunlia tyrosinilytica]|uniref:Uncharacterized protein n=1 Tax=Wenjunlia tyrosinilytica TaxID=1544741 RepID=A0A918DWK5_9ACTN|nr:hypothetical protein GCM10012280_24010 [Wenjunlia tyrosinilytica]